MKKIVVTSTTCPRLEIERVQVVHVPLLVKVCLEFTPPDCDIAVFFSKHAVRCAHASGLDLTGKVVWAVGGSTAEVVASTFAIHPRVPDDPSFAGLVSALRAESPSGRIASFELAEGPRTLAGEFENVVVVPTYVTVKRCESELLPVLASADAVLFASPRAVEAFQEIGASTEILTSPSARKALVGSIGPTTTAALRAAGFSNIVESAEPNLEILIRQLASTAGD